MEEDIDRGTTPIGPVDPETQKENPEDEIPERGKWANKTEFLLSVAGEIIGLGNVWRFPYLCYKNGGGVFFIPYFVFLFFCGIPVFFLETALGQYTSEGGVTSWRKICPMFEGVGIASQVIVAYLNIYYIVVLAWGLFYLFHSFQNPLPWSTCDNNWNTEYCHNYRAMNSNLTYSDWSFLHNETDLNYEVNISTESMKITSPEEEFWDRRVLRTTNMSLGAVQWELALCLLLAWVICYFCIWKGVKTTGKVVYFTATFPYLMLILLFFRGVTLPGAGEGLKYYLWPQMDKLLEPAVWRDAGTQVFFSYAVCQGVLTSLGSYNKYNNNCYKDCVALCILNSGTSIFAGFAVFSVLGFMAHSLNVHIDTVVEGGPGLIFVAYPKAVTLLPGAQFWAVLFFLMVIFLGLDSQFVCVESLATAITDIFPGVLRRPGRREVLVLGIAVVCFLLGLPLISENGIVLFMLVDTYGPSGISLLLIACFECIAVAWIYGANRFLDNIEDMIGYRPLPWVLKYCWLFVTPLICVITMLYDALSSSSINIPGVYNVLGPWAPRVAALLTLTPLLCIPVFVLLCLWRNRRGITTPSSDLRQARPHQPRLTLCKYVIIKGQEEPPRINGEDEKLALEETVGV
ncbi:hypothetical protein UPYG_G00348760 [Umbra pygmaea]|uniref:Transporter n=1 Tax=Umbra pygmaea TaxID=75934 RepID=A0ABD0W2H7_UMBPY